MFHISHTRHEEIQTMGQKEEFCRSSSNFVEVVVICDIYKSVNRPSLWYRAWPEKVYALLLRHRNQQRFQKILFVVDTLSK